MEQAIGTPGRKRPLHAEARPSLPIAAGAPGIPGAARPDGLALRFDEGRFRIEVCDASGATLLSLGPYDESEVVAAWRRLAADSGLPLMVVAPDGGVDRPYPQIGRIRLGLAVDRRRLAVLSGRRPRFLVRRKSARLPACPTIHAGREIATGSAR